MKYWLFKTEPEEFSIQDLKRVKTVTWDGIRNYQARNFLRDQIKKDDIVLVYHSSTKLIGVAGIAKIKKEAFADPTQFDPKSKYYDPKSLKENPKWISVDLKFEKEFKEIISVKELKQIKKLSDMLLFKNPRLSVQPITKLEFETIISL